MLDKHVKAFIIYITTLLTIAIHLAKKAQIASLFTKKIQILSKYSDFSDVFLEEKFLMLLEATNLNQYTIKL